MTRAATGVLLAALLVAEIACEQIREVAAHSPAQAAAGPRPSAPPFGATVVDGHRRIEWDQTGRSLEVIQRYRYVAVVDATPTDLMDVWCVEGTARAQFVCSGQMPAMQPGVHLLRVIAVAEPRSSPWSVPLVLFKP